jgi:hypothetical protein
MVDVTDRFAGTWKLLTCEGQWSDGRITRPYGEEPGGMLVYDGRGSFSGQIMAHERPAFATGNLLKGSDAEVRAAFEGYVAYYGSYWVDEAEELMIHQVEGSFFPNWIGERQIRQFEFTSEGKLQLSTLPIKGARAELTVVLVWERAE